MFWNFETIFSSDFKDYDYSKVGKRTFFIAIKCFWRSSWKMYYRYFIIFYLCCEIVAYRDGFVIDVDETKPDQSWSI